MTTHDTHSDLSPTAIKALRRARGLSQQGLATLLGVGVATVSRWERGTPPTGTAAVILYTLIAGPTATRETEKIGRGGYAIYQLLKDIFESKEA